MSMNRARYTRRRMLARTGWAALSGLAVPSMLIRAAQAQQPGTVGVVAGESTAADVGNRILRQDGNAVDAVVAAAPAARVGAPPNCRLARSGRALLHLQPERLGKP